MRLSDLAPNPKNPRTCSPEKLEMLKKSLAEFGDLSGIVYNRKTKRLIGGHQRSKILDSKAAIEITKKYPKPTKTGTVAEGYALVHGERFVYREVSWDETKEKAANIAANKGAGEFDLAGLSEWMRDLESMSFDLDLTMFDSDERAALKDFGAEKVEGKCDEDEIPEKVEAKTKRGDIYLLGNHRLMCGDSTKDTEKLFGDQKADMCFTSPPYNLGISAKLRGNTKIGKRGNAYESYDDAQDESEWLSLVSIVTEISLKHCRYVFWNIQPLAGNRRAIWKYADAFAERYCEVFVWDKQHAQPAAAARVANSRFEFVWVFTSDEKPSRAIRIAPEFRGTIDNVYVAPPQRKNEASDSHGASFPVHFPEYFITNFCPVNGSVYEPFCGTGTTIIACEKTNRKCYAMELDPHYCDVIVARWEKFTGKKARLAR